MDHCPPSTLTSENSPLGSDSMRRLVLPGVELYLGDCRELLATLKADAVITDPPYGIKQDKGMGGGGYDSTGRYKRKPRQYAGGWDDEAPDAELLQMVIASAPIKGSDSDHVRTWFNWNSA